MINNMANNQLQGSDISINLRGDSKIDLDTLNWAVVVYHSDDILNKQIITKAQSTKISANYYLVKLKASITKDMIQGYQNIELKTSDGQTINILKKSNAFMLDISASKDIEL